MVRKAFSVTSLCLAAILLACPISILSAKAESGAIQLRSVSVTRLAQGIRITVAADRRIESYNAFVLENPARIVFDFPRMKGTSRSTRIIPIGSEWASSVRHFAHPDKVRLVIDTNQTYLKAYTARAFPGGLHIYVGSAPKKQMRPAAKSAPRPPADDRRVSPRPMRDKIAPKPVVPVRREGERRRLHAMRVEQEAITLDGRLDEPVWKRTQAATGFVQYQPDDGDPASEKTEARVLYGERELYVGFRAFERDPSAIDAQLTRRDQRSFSDWVSVAIDSYNDRRTAFQFSVNPKGVKRDACLHDDTRWDSDWDAVWEVATAVDSLGWSAEFRIPYSQLRFSRTADQTWGIQFGRMIARREEMSYWSPMTIREYAVVSKFGTLSGVNGIKPSRRLEIMPYTMAQLQRGPGEEENPMYEEIDTSVKLGTDLKYGVTGDLTLDVTVNPDFGQVEADPAQVNLTAFETYFSERRPFFIEGANIFDFVLGFGPTGMPDEKLFYSRRIGRAPHGSLDLEDKYTIKEEETPEATTILTAEKVSGKTASGWTIGLLHAATAEEKTHIIAYEDPEDGEDAPLLCCADIERVVEPSTHYSFARLQRDFQGGYSALGLVTTGVFRQSDDADALDLPKRAITGGVDFRHRFWSNKYEISAFFLGSKVSGSKGAISSLQQASSRYMQRPDADHVDFDPDRESLSGTSAMLNFRKVGQGSWRYGGVIRSRSPGFEVNDLGFARQSDLLMAATYVGYFHYLPSKYLRRWSLMWNTWHVQTHGSERTRLGTDIYSRYELPNYWTVRAGVNYDFGSLDTDMLRGGPAFKADDRVNVFTRISTDSRKKMQANLSASYSGYREADSGSYRISPSIDWRPAGRVQMSLGVSYSKNERDSQWVDRWWKRWWEVTEATPYIFGHMSQETLSMTSRLDVAFTPNLSLQLYAQPFISAGRFSEFKQVVDPRAEKYVDRFVLLTPEADVDCYGGYSSDVAGSAHDLCMSNQDFNYKQFRSNAVLRWEYRPGSVLFVVWSQGRQHSDEAGDLNFNSDFGTLFGAASDDVFLIKVRHWF